MGDVIRFKKSDYEYAECSVCGATAFHICIEDDPDDDECYIVVGQECVVCHSYSTISSEK